MKKAKLIALLAAVVAAVLIFFFFNTLSQSGLRDTTPIVTAALDIPANTSITAEMITLTKVPDAAIIGGAVKDKELVLGRMTKSQIFKGEQILDVKLISPGEKDNSSLAYAIEPGMRAMTVSVDANTGLSGMLKPQNRVDLICDLEYQTTGAEARVYTTLVAENIKLLAVDDVLSEQGKTAVEGGSPSYATITLEVTPKQAMEISIAVYKGQLRTILRSPLDETMTNVPNQTIENMMAN